MDNMLLSRRLISYIVLFVLVSGLACNVSASRQWTFMVYIDGDNNLEGAGIEDINEMEMVGPSDNVSIVVYFDRIPYYDYSNGDWTGAKLFSIVKDYDTSNISSTELEDLGELNSADPATLVYFVNYSVNNFPADHYALVLWDHGSGWKERGVGNEDKPITKNILSDSTSGDHMSMVELRQALQELNDTLGVKYDILQMDACLMGTIEVMYQFYPFADYFVGSQETEPWDGADYNATLSYLVANPGTNLTAFVSYMVDNYMDSYSSSYTGITQSAIDLGRIPALASAVDAFGQVLMNESKTPIKNAITGSESFTYSDYVDLYNLSQRVNNSISSRGPSRVSSAVADVFSALDDAVVHEGHRSGSAHAHGITIYATSAGVDPNYLNQTLFSNDTHWDEMLVYIGPERYNYTGASILLVDGDGGSAYEDYYTNSFDSLGVSHDIWTISLEGASPNVSVLSNYSTVVWFTGDTYSSTLNSVDQSNLQTYMDSGGGLFTTGHLLAYPSDLHDSDFYSDYLHAQYVGTASAAAVEGVTGDPVSDGVTSGIWGSIAGDGANSNYFAHEITPVDDGMTTVIFNYSGGLGVAGLRADNLTYRVVYLAFGFENLNSSSNRNRLMNQTLTWLSVRDSPGSPANSNWPMFHGTARQTGFSSYNGPTTNHTLWAINLSSSPGVNSVAIGGGEVIYTGAGNELNAIYSNGTLRWSHAIPGAGGPAVTRDGTVYVCGSDGLTAIYSNGTQKWNYYMNRSFFGPTIGDDGVVYQGAWDHYFYAVYPNGTLNWKYLTDGSVSYSAGILSDGTIVLGGGDAHSGPDPYLYAFYPNGTLRWRFNTTAERVGSPVIGSGDVIYAPASPDLIAFYPNGTLKWRIGPSGGYYFAIVSPALDSGGTLYIGNSGTDGRFHAVYPNGSIKWVVELIGNESGGRGLPSFPVASSNGIVYVGGVDHVMYALNTTDGSMVWNYTTDGGITEASPALSEDGVLYFGSEDGYLYAVQDTTTTTTTTTSTTSTTMSCDDAYVMPQYNQSYSGSRYYKFTTYQTCDVNVSMMPSGADYDLYTLWNGSCPSTGAYDCRPYHSSSTPEYCNKTGLPPGTYRVMVRRYTGSGYFNITVETSNCVGETTTTTSTVSTTSTTSASSTTSTVSTSSTTSTTSTTVPSGMQYFDDFNESGNWTWNATYISLNTSNSSVQYSTDVNWRAAWDNFVYSSQAGTVYEFTNDFTYHLDVNTRQGVYFGFVDEIIQNDDGSGFPEDMVAMRVNNYYGSPVAVFYVRRGNVTIYSSPYPNITGYGLYRYRVYVVNATDFNVTVWINGTQEVSTLVNENATGIATNKVAIYNVKTNGALPLQGVYNGSVDYFRVEEIAPSTSSGHNITLQSGWNLVSMPLSMDGGGSTTTTTTVTTTSTTVSTTTVTGTTTTTTTATSTTGSTVSTTSTTTSSTTSITTPTTTSTTMSTTSTTTTISTTSSTMTTTSTTTTTTSSTTTTTSTTTTSTMPTDAIFVNASYAGAEYGNITHPWNTITEGISSASAGDIVYVFPGTYNGTFTVNKQITLMANNLESTVIDCRGTYDTCITISADNVWFTGFTVRNTTYISGYSYSKAGLYLTGSNINLTHNVIEDHNLSGVYAYYSSGHRIEENVFRRCGYPALSALRFVMSNDSVVSGNDFTGNPNGVDSSYVGNTLISDNDFLNNTKGISVADTTSLRIQGNRFDSNIEYGIYIYDSGGGVYHVNVSGNTFDSNPTGIRVYLGNEGTADNDVRILDNLFTNSNGTGIDLAAYGYRNITVVGNTMTNHINTTPSRDLGVGLMIEGSDKVLIANNTIVFNDKGIRFDGSHNVSLTGNNISYNSYGLYSHGGDSYFPVFQNNYVAYNTFTGLRLSTVDNASLIGNILCFNGGGVTGGYYAVMHSANNTACIELLSPEDDATLSQTPSFSFNVSNVPGPATYDYTLPCGVYANSNLIGQNDSLDNRNTTVYPSSELDDGVYNWYVYCNSSSGDTGLSETRTLTMSSKH